MRRRYFWGIWDFIMFENVCGNKGEKEVWFFLYEVVLEYGVGEIKL